jgi:hypothetical protein
MARPSTPRGSATLVRRRPSDAAQVPALDPLRAIADEHGVFLRREALALGLSDNDLARSLRSGVLVRVRHGCYTFADLWASVCSEGRHLVAARAVMRRVGAVALSHTTAALAHEMDVWEADLARVHVTRLDGGAGRTEADLVHHEGFVGDDDLTTALGLPIVRPARAALEAALLNGVESGLVTVCSGLRRSLYSQEELARQHGLMTAWPDAQPLQIVARLADGAFESVGEVRSAYLMWRAGLPRPEPQFEILDHMGRLVARVDFAWPQRRLVVEFDGAAKYSRFVRPGESPGDVVFREKLREDALRAAGWTVVRLTWADLQSPEQAVARIRRAWRVAA